ncbi:hypothetical protein B0T19DRAFT_397637 [Cercophora scortea]|uniref:DUF7587 domain-containing protein n=1 Tax=Cercophora scortea TaxID=314031 RepID=A0AAE0IUZ6_9PEZI|nr:hypothetical protein B0T19DRAFT_397637 [Cercophora scortea]
MSKDALSNSRMFKVDIFSASQRDEEVAAMLNRHLWWHKSNQPDNFVSWISSLLYAVQYMLYCFNRSKRQFSLDQIQLLMVDTTLFPSREILFMEDVDLINIYAEFGQPPQASQSKYNGNSLGQEKTLAKLARMRSGLYLFGEYLSQGALRVEGKCKSITLEALIGRGLFSLRHDFLGSPALGPDAKENSGWAKEVVKLREVFAESGRREPVTASIFHAALGITEGFESPLRLPFVIYFLSLYPRRLDNTLRLLFEGHFTVRKLRKVATYLAPESKGKAEDIR